MDRKWNAENRMHILYYIQNPRAQKSEICFTWGPGMQKLYKYGPWSLELQKNLEKNLKEKIPIGATKAKIVVGPGNPLAKCNSWGASFKTSFYLVKSKKIETIGRVHESIFSVHNYLFW
jgi:hypothetical protein